MLYICAVILTEKSTFKIMYLDRFKEDVNRLCVQNNVKSPDFDTLENVFL